MINKRFFRKRINKIKYTIKNFSLIEENMYSNIITTYDLTDDKEKLFFQVKLKHFSRYYMQVDIDSYDLYLLHKLRWL